jgi:hypothetical protein
MNAINTVRSGTPRPHESSTKMPQLASEFLNSFHHASGLRRTRDSEKTGRGSLDETRHLLPCIPLSNVSPIHRSNRLSLMFASLRLGPAAYANLSPKQPGERL